MRDAVCVLVFSRTPRPGHVMTRLASRIGAIAATRLYRSLVLRTLDTVMAGGLPACLYRYGKGRRGDWLYTQARQRGMPIHNQYGRDLGARMYHAIHHRLVAGAAAAIVTGCDCPDLTPDILTAAAHALKQDADLVLGPALDGGYYLIGMCQSHVRLFGAVPWGTDEVAGITLSRAESAGLRIHQLPPLGDLDCLEDLARYPDLQGGLLRADYPGILTLPEIIGEVPERPNGLDWKSGVRFKSHRGFESHPLRHSRSKIPTCGGVNPKWRAGNPNYVSLQHRGIVPAYPLISHNSLLWHPGPARNLHPWGTQSRTHRDTR